MPLTLDLDFADASTYVDGTPHAVFARLRRECPVYWNVRRKDGTGFWCVTRYADIAAIHKDTTRFSSRKNVALNDYDGGAAEDLILLQMDPPKHTAMRNVLARAFTPRRIADLVPAIRYHATCAIDAVIGQGACDLSVVAQSLPIRMICQLLGIPDELHLKVLDWTNRTFGRDEYSQGEDDTFLAFQEIFQYAFQLIAERKAEPRDDLASVLAAAEIEGRPLDEMELGWMLFLLIGAGNDTTRTLITNAARLFLEDPAIWERLKAEPERLPQAIEEALRLEPSVRCMGRTATVDVDLHGTTIRAGDPVFLWYPSGNRDEAMFADPDRFDLDRADAMRQQSFGGGGPHHCIGAPLARLQTRIIFEELMRRMPDLALAGTPVRARTDGFMNSLKHLPVRFTPGARVFPAPPGR